jgi:hypothetical protein
MGEVDRYPHGTFCWIDLGTTDVARAKAFYEGLFGWEIEDVPAGENETYSLCRVDGKDVAGIHEHTAEEGTGWSSNISVDEVDAATEQAKELGASVLVEGLDVPDAGRTSAIRDPSGAAVGLWEPKGHIGARLVNEVGAWSWNELVTPDVEAAKAFYGGLFGWTAQDVPAGMPRAAFSLGELLIGGVHAPSEREGSPPPNWAVSFRVADVEESTELGERVGGRILLPPMDFPIGRFSILSDPGGAAFTIASFAAPFNGVDGS